MGWICFSLLIFWTIWTICTNTGNIVTFIVLATCGVVAVSFGVLVLEWMVIGLVGVITFIHDHGRAILVGVGGIVATVFVLFSIRNVPVVHYPASDRLDDQ
jgi:hypothetical protein